MPQGKDGNSVSHQNKETKMTCNQPPVSRLNTMMKTIFGIMPSYELILNDLTPGMTKFMWRITCPVSPTGVPMSVEGPHGRNKKEAKHNAAELFLKKFLTNKVKKRSKSAKLIYKAAVICFEGRDMLEDICSKNNLGRPKYAEMKTLSSSTRSTRFQIYCKLGNLRTRGKGKNKIEARLHATARMLQVLMETTSVHDLLKSGQMTTISNNVTEIVCSSQRVSSTSLPNLSQVCEQPEPCDIPLSIKQEIESDPVMSNVQLESIENSGQETCDAVPSCSTTLNNNEWHCADSQLERSMGLYAVNGTLTRLQAVSQIDRTLGNCEKELYNKIVGVIVCNDIPYYHHTVTILCHNYQVFIQHGEPLKILEDGILEDGILECCDQSIRTACLIEVLLNLKECIVTNSFKRIKTESV